LTTLSVVIPTTHRVDQVMQLVQQIAATSPVPTEITVVDNTPRATRTGWEQFEGQLIVRDKYLGSEQAFVLGLKYAPKASRYLLLDHDARLYDNSLSSLLGAATDDNAVYSGNQNGDGSSWDRQNGRAPAPRDLSSTTVLVEFAPWSGLLLNPVATEIIVSQDSGLFFFYDDYLACWHLKRSGLRIWGVPAAVIENESIPGEQRSPWRAYYTARNHILFHRLTGCGTLTELIFFRSRDLSIGMLRARRIERTKASVLGILDGMRDRRGPQMLPSE
jgi:GT2 family glycosyltransferase